MPRHSRADLDAQSWLKEVDHDETDHQRQRRGDFKISHGFEGDTSHGLQFTRRRNAINQCSEKQRRHNRPNQAKKNVADRRELNGKARKENTDQNANNKRDKNPGGEAQLLE